MEVRLEFGKFGSELSLPENSRTLALIGCSAGRSKHRNDELAGSAGPCSNLVQCERSFGAQRPGWPMR